MRQQTEIKAPEHLKPETRAWYEHVCREYVLESHHLRTLQIAAECWDRRQQARDVLDRQGLTIEDKYGTVKPHPCVAIEKDAGAQFVRCIRELNLDTEGPSEESARPPALRRVR